MAALVSEAVPAQPEIHIMAHTAYPLSERHRFPLRTALDMAQRRQSLVMAAAEGLLSPDITITSMGTAVVERNPPLYLQLLAALPIALFYQIPSAIFQLRRRATAPRRLITFITITMSLA